MMKYMHLLMTLTSKKCKTWYTVMMLGMFGCLSSYLMYKNINMV